MVSLQVWPSLKFERRLAFSEDTCLEKERLRLKATPKGSWSGIETEAGVEKNEVGLEVGLVGIHEKKGGLTFARIERKTPVLRPALQSKQSLLYGFHSSRDRGGGRPNDQIVSVKRAADGRRQRSREITYEEREKYRAKNGSLQNILILINHASAPIRKEKLNPASKARREASRNEFVEKSGIPDRVKSFREINSRKNRPRARPGFVKPTGDGLSKEQN